MKKFIVALVIALCITLMPTVKAEKIELPEVTDHEKVKVYLFWADYCHNCHNFIEYFADEYVKYEDYFEIITYQTDGEADNSSLMSAVGEKLDFEVEGIPFIVIGDYKTQGFGESTGENVIKEALAAYQDENYKDYVAEAASEITEKGESRTFTEACEVAKIECAGSGEADTEKGLSDGVVIGIIFGVIILGFGGLIIYSRK